MENRIKELRKAKDIKQTVLAKSLNVTQANLSGWENNKWQPDSDAIAKMCNIFSCTADYLMGITSANKKNFTSHGVKIPVLGTIPAGIPIEAIEDVLDYEEISESMASHGDYFALKVKGDSMLPTIKNGDIVIVRQQDDADTGDICVVMVDGGDATLKEIKKEPNGLWVLPHNPDSDFRPTFYTKEEVYTLPVRILGVAVEIRRSLR